MTSDQLERFRAAVLACPLARCSVGVYGFDVGEGAEFASLAEVVNQPPHDLVVARFVRNPREWLSVLKPSGVIMCADLKVKTAPGFTLEGVGEFWRLRRKQ